MSAKWPGYPREPKPPDPRAARGAGPVSAYLVGAAPDCNEDMRTVLVPVRTLAERTGVAVVAISHLTKKAEVGVLYRAMGSLAVVAVALSAQEALDVRARALRRREQAAALRQQKSGASRGICS